MLHKTQDDFYTFLICRKYPAIICAVTTKKLGDQKIKKKEDQIFLPSLNFQKFHQKIAPNFSYVAFEQIHGDKIAEVETGMKNKILPGFDGGVTKEKRILLAIFIADCFPILAFDPINEVIGLAHAGWRGVKSGIVENLVRRMEKMGSVSKNIIVGIGPGICGKCYAIREDVALKFNQRFLERKGGKIFLNLEGAICDQLIKSGIKEENIELSKTCVFENRNYFSVRREQNTGRMAAVIGIK